MGPDGVVERDPLADDPVRLETIGQLVQADRLVFERPPQTFDEDVVHVPAPAVHGDRDLRVLENAGELVAGELAALIRIEDFRLAVSGQRVVQSLDAEPDSMVFDSRQARTWRVAQSTIATRYRKPPWTGM